MDTPSISENLFANGGEMGALMGQMDWSKTPLGAVETWSQSLKTAVRIMLTSRQAMFVWWGDDLINLHNDAYRAILGGKHPMALGQPASAVWREIWDQVGPRAETAIFKNEGTYDEALLLIMERNGYPEETYYTFSYSPIPDQDGSTGGIICANTEDTQRIIGERQLTLLRELAANTADARTFDEACTLSVDSLQTNPYDLPFAIVYGVDPDRQQVFLAGTSGIDRLAVPDTIDLGSDAVWPVAQVLDTQKAVLISDLAAFDELPTGAWDRPPHQAVAVPIGTRREGTAPSGQTGVLIVGLNPLRLFDDNYQGFIDLVAGQIAASITNAQAYEAERLRAEALAELDRAKTAFFSNVSHEFRTPLTLMLSPLEDAIANLDGTLPAQEREQLQLVQRNGLRLLKLVNSLLDFSRIEAGRVQAAYEPTDLASYTADLASAFRSLIERAEMSLIVECSPLPAAVYVDRDMWEKIVLNLLSNAFKFTLTGAITVRLQWLDDRVELSVADTGVGIPAEELPHLFERFHRVENSQGRSFEGTGIGLSLVQELVKLHGGTIVVSSQFGQGSCFTATIPTGTAHLPKERISASRTLASTALGAMPYVEEAQRWLPQDDDFRLPILDFRLEDAATNFAPTPALSSTQSKLQTPNSKILLADDNADMRDYISRLLSSTYTVQTVADGAAALSAIANNPPDLVITDVMMPGIDGFELLRLLRSNSTTQNIPIVLLSARAGEEARIEGLEAGADDYLIKPFSARELLARVEATLKLSQLRRDTLNREQRLRAESEIAQQQAEAAYRRIDQLLESMSDAFVALDKDWRITYQNATAERINNKPRSQVLGKTLWEEWPAAIGSIADQQYHYAIAHQVSVHFEQHYYEPPDHDVWLEVHAYPFEDGLGIFYRDISARKRIEVEREHLLQREQVAREAAETANQIKDEFLAVLSHELRTPLNPILGWSRLLQQGKLDAAKTQQALATIERNAQLQSQLIEDLLDISRILRGKLSLTVQPVDLKIVISAALETIRLAAEAKSLHIQTVFSPTVEAVMGDTGRLQQVVWNLLSNAVKFTPQGGQITVTLTETGTHAQLQVIDTGKGINPEFLPYVFDHFRQEDGATTRKFGGLGLGLAIVRQIVELHGGTVVAESQGEAQGATFTVEIPLAPRFNPLPTPESALDSTPDLRGIRILVVDDEADSREFVAFVLEQFGAIVTQVGSGIEALQLLEQSVPDLLVSDIGMPEMDGYMLMQQLRTLKHARQVSAGASLLPKAVALTAYAGEYDRQQALSAGFQRHLSKPIDPAKLLETLLELIR